MSTLFGWFFDVYPSGDGMCLWLLDTEGRMHALSDTFAPVFYVRGPRDGLRALCQHLRTRRRSGGMRHRHHAIGRSRQRRSAE